MTDDGTFIYGIRGDYATKTGEAFLLDRSYVIKDMRKVVGDSLHTDKRTGFSEAFWNAVLTDEENDCMLTGHYCSYDDSTGTAVATDSAVAYEYSQPPDTLYLHGDTLKMFTFNMNTDSVYRDMRMLKDDADYAAIGGDSYLSGYVKGFEPYVQYQYGIKDYPFHHTKGYFQTCTSGLQVPSPLSTSGAA